VVAGPAAGLGRLLQCETGGRRCGAPRGARSYARMWAYGGAEGWERRCSLGPVCPSSRESCRMSVHRPANLAACTSCWRCIPTTWCSDSVNAGRGVREW